MDLNYVNMIIQFNFSNGPTNIRKSGKRVPVPYRAPSLRPGESRSVTVLKVLDDYGIRVALGETL